MKIGIIGPSEDEIIPFIKNLENPKMTSIAMLNFYTGFFNNLEITALYCGVCKVNASIATQILIDKFNVTHIFVVGVAGGIDSSLSIGDTIISTKVCYHDVEQTILTEYHPFMNSIYFQSDNHLLEIANKVSQEVLFPQKILFGKIVTGESFIDINGRQEIIDKYNPLCVDMETASIAHVCHVNKISFIAIRSITDTEDSSGIDNFEINCRTASLNSINFLEALLKML